MLIKEHDVPKYMRNLKDLIESFKVLGNDVRSWKMSVTDVLLRLTWSMDEKGPFANRYYSSGNEFVELQGKKSQRVSAFPYDDPIKDFIGLFVDVTSKAAKHLKSKPQKVLDELDELMKLVGEIEKFASKEAKE